MSGAILGRDFSARTATYFIDRRPGYEHLDLVLSSLGAEDPCSHEVSANGLAVWLRRWGAGALEPGQYRVSRQAPGPWEAHYQVKQGRSWAGSGDAAALIVVNDVAPDRRIHGLLSACYADQTASCVAGSFVATPCVVQVDAPIRGTQAMERPPARSPGSPSGVPQPSPPTPPAEPGKDP